MKTITIKLGGKPNLKGFKVSPWAKDLLTKIKYSKKKQDIDLEILTVKELGLPDGGTLEEFYAKAKEKGLELCPAEVGPQLRVQYKDQPKGEWLLIAMEPVADSLGNLGVFSVEHRGDGPCLYGDYGSPGSFWDGSGRWVFARRKSLGTLPDPLPSFYLRLQSLEEKFEDFRKKVEAIIKL